MGRESPRRAGRKYIGGVLKAASSVCRFVGRSLIYKPTYMKPRHAAALALVGWYLMTPPPQKLGDNADNLSFGRWGIQQSFDSATACERARKLTISRASKQPVNAEGQTKEDVNMVNKMVAKYVSPSMSPTPFKATAINPNLAAVCISTDDPRHKETK